MKYDKCKSFSIFDKLIDVIMVYNLRMGIGIKLSIPSIFYLMIDVNDLLVLVIEDNGLITVSRNDLRDFEYNLTQRSRAFLL